MDSCSSALVDEEIDSSDWSPPMGEHRLRLRPWLESMLDSRQIKGLEWLDDKKTCFKIPWKHRSKKDWDTDHVKVFMEWARHTGKYHEGEEPDYVAMKTRLRCAFNKAQDIEEVKQLHSLKSAEPYRVYRFIQKPDIGAWKESQAKQPPSFSRVCPVHPTVYPLKEDDSSSETDDICDSDDDDDVIFKFSGRIQQDPTESTKLELNPGKSCHVSVEDIGLKKIDYAMKPLISISSSQSCVDTNDAAKLLLSLKGGAEEKAPLVTKDFKGNLRSECNNGVPLELISHLLTTSSLRKPPPLQPPPPPPPDICRAEVQQPPNTVFLNDNKIALESGAVVVSAGSCHQGLVQANGALLDPKQFVTIQEYMCKQETVSNSAYQDVNNTALASGGLQPQAVQVKNEVISPQSGTILQSQSPSIGNNSPPGDALVSNGAVLAAQQLLPINIVPSSQISPQTTSNFLVSTEVPNSDCSYHDTRHRKSRRLVHTPLSVKHQFPVVHKALTRKQRIPEGMTFSNHGNIMATGVKNSVKDVAVTKEPVLCEEMLRMREAYGVPIYRTVEEVQMHTEAASDNNGNKNADNEIETCAEVESDNGGDKTAVSQSSSENVANDQPIQNDTHSEENKNNLDVSPPNLIPPGQDVHGSGKADSKVADDEKSAEEKDYEILDLRVSADSATKVNQECTHILDLSVKNEAQKTCCLTQEGALDLTLKRKNENGNQPMGKRQAVKKGASLTMYAIWDLSKPKDKEDEAPAKCPTTAVDLTHSPGSSTIIKSEEGIKCEDIGLKTDNDFGDHNYFSTKPVVSSTISQGIVVLETDSIVKEFTIKTEVSADDTEANEANKLSQVPTLVSEHSATDYEDSSDDSRDQDINDDDDDDDVDNNDEDNDTRLAAKQLLELSNRCHMKGKHLPSEELIKAAENKHLRTESQQKRASYSGNNWGADLYRKGSPPSNSSTMSRDSSGTRQRLRPWLESKISSGEIKGLEWVEKDKGIFKIPWKHGGKHDWTPENSRIFMEWAKHTGRYRQGIDEEDYATWKTRLRCAFNKAPDIEELKDKTDLNCSEPYRVYRLVPKKEMQRFLTPVSSLPENSAERTNIAPEKQRLPLLLEEFDDNHDLHYPSDLKSLPSGDLLTVPVPSSTKDLTSVIEEQIYPSDPNTGAPETMAMVTTQPNCTLTEMTPISVVAITEAEMLAMGGVASKPIFSTFIPDETSDIISSGIPLLGTATAMERHCTVSEIHIQLKYQNRVIRDKLIDGQQGCLITSDIERLQQRVVLAYPPKSQPETHQENQIMSLLPFMKDGVWITSRNGSIFAKRSCKCGVFHVSATGTNGRPEKLKRNDREEMIFDFEGSFLPALEHCKQFGGVAPDPCVHLIFGQTCQLNQLDKNILISATITSQKAQECLQPPKMTRPQSHLERVKTDNRQMVELIDTDLLVTTIDYCAASTVNVIDSTAMDTT